MKIALIVRKLTVSGGVQRQALSLANELSKMGHTIKIYTFDYSKDNCLPALTKNLEIISLPHSFKKKTSGIFGFFNETIMAKRLSRLIDIDTDILHPHDTVAHHVAYFFKKSVKNIPSVWNMNEIPATRWPLSLISFAEDSNFHDIPRKPLWLKKMSIMIRIYYDNFFVKKQDIITVFDTFHKNMLKRYSGMESVVVPSGADSESFTFFERRPIDKSGKVFLLSSGIFTSYRRFEDIIEAVSILHKKGYDVYLTILGKYETDMKYFRALTNLAESLKIKERVIFLGPYTDSQLMDFFSKSHIFVFPHLQSQGLSVYEAMLSGLPCIVTPLMGTYETLTDKKDVLFAEVKNPASIAEKIEELIKNQDLYTSISRQGAETIRNNFSWRKYAKDMISVFDLAINNARRKF